MTSPRHRHSENSPDSEALRDFAWSPTRSFKPLHKICDFDLMFDAHIRDGHLHSRTDKLVPVSQALRMAEALQEKGKVYALHIYDRDGHSLPLNREDRNRMIIDWFNKPNRLKFLSVAVGEIVSLGYINQHPGRAAQATISARHVARADPSARQGRTL